MANTNYFDHTNKEFQNVTVSVMNDILNSDISGSSMDDLYEAFCRYLKVTKEQFTEIYSQATKKLQESPFGTEELNEEDLEMVVGGMDPRLKKVLITTAVIVAAALIFSGVGATIGAGIGAATAGIQGLTTAAAAAHLATAGAIAFIPSGLIFGAILSQTDEIKQLFF